MPIYTRKEFIKLYEISSQYLSVNTKRGFIIVQGKFIDSENPYNKIWIEKQLEKLEDKKAIQNEEIEIAKPITKPIKKIKEVVIRDIEIPKLKKQFKDIEIPEITEVKINVENASRTDLDLIKKKLDIKKLNEEYELAKIKKEKQMGLVIPTDLVLGTFSRHFKGITDSFYQAADNICIEIVSSLGGDRKDLAKIRSRLVVIINEAVSESKLNSKKEIKSIVSEYAETRGKGERK